jgi:hypothetical protein
LHSRSESARPWPGVLANLGTTTFLAPPAIKGDLDSFLTFVWQTPADSNLEKQEKWSQNAGCSFVYYTMTDKLYFNQLQITAT